MAFPIIPKLNSAPGAGAPDSLTLGELAANRSTAKLYLGTDTGVQELAFAGALGGTAISTFTAAGGTSFYPLNGYTSTDVSAYLVSVGGIEQRPTVDWTISAANGGTIVFTTAPPTGVPIVVRAVIAGAGGGGTDIGGRAWSSTATYTEGDLVATSQTETWICIQGANTNQDPATSPEWWAPAPASAVQLQFRPIAATAPTNGQVIGWSDANANWEPINVFKFDLQDIAIGSESYSAAGNSGIAIGSGSAVSGGQNSLVIGTNSNCQAGGCVLVGCGSFSGAPSIVIGAGLNSQTAEILIGNASYTSVSVGAYNLASISSKINEIINWANSSGASITPL